METDYEELPPAPAGVQTARDQEGEEASEEDNNDEEGAAHEEEEEEDGQDSDEEVAGMLTSPAVARKAPASSAQRGRGARARSSPESGEGEERLSPSKQRTPRRSTNSQLDKGKNKKQKRKSTPPPPPAAETFSSPEPEDDPRPKPTFDLSQLRKVARSRSRSRSARKESMRIAEESEEEEDEEDPDREDNEERPAIFKHWDSHDKQWRSDRVWLYHVFGSEQERNQLARQIEDNGGKVVEKLKDADIAVFPRGEAKSFFVSIQKAKGRAVLPVRQLWVEECLQSSKQHHPLNWRCTPSSYEVTLNAIGSSTHVRHRRARHEFTEREKETLAREFLWLLGGKLRSETDVARAAMLKHPNAHPLESWRGQVKNHYAEYKHRALAIKRQRKAAGRRPYDTTSEEEEEDDDELPSDVAEEEGRGGTDEEVAEELERQRAASILASGGGQKRRVAEEEEVDELEEEEEEDLPSVEVLGAARVVAGLRKRLRSVSRELVGALEREEQEQEQAEEEVAPAPRPSKKQKRKKEKRAVEEPEPQLNNDQQPPAARPVVAATSHPTVSALTTFTARYPALTPHQITGVLYYTSFNLVEAEVACSRLTAQESVDGVLWEVEEDEKLLRGVEWLDGRDGHAVEARRKFLKSIGRARREQGLEGLVMWHPSRET